MIELRAVRGKTGRLLAELIRAGGVEVGGRTQGVVSYGVPCRSELPTLNANAGRLNKFEELEALYQKGIPTVPFGGSPEGRRWPVPPWFHDGTNRVRGPFFARNLKHTKGRDIQVKGPDEHGVRGDYYTQYIPHTREFRVWAYRGLHLGTYEKIRRFRRGRRHPDMIWNWRNGYAFEFLAEAPDNLKQIGRDAVAALDLDFGAVDVIQTSDGRYLVLEVNTAPGTQGPRQGLQNLAVKIVNWARGGFKRRRGDVKPD